MGSKSLRHKASDAPESATVLKVLFRKGEDGYVIAECPQLPGCMSQGKTEEDARRNIMDAIRSVRAIRGFANPGIRYV
jgi:hypothetical protein